ncbi:MULTISPECIES: hypothetical protein [unclassified Duganella]|uniref:hypothetical protein n=1 Tax=unclassified Duganella TaxID=2636909 RepID=UPI0008853286|nr:MULTISPECIES: hypothetical protein [unclassified Duganella]SDH06433.1 hypothetical protein SAMN05216320_109158 [Duganella sp. OV458]SDK19679.1 hypothetical protein SAMN05428973_109124 [Duganella sp. OV510]
MQLSDFVTSISGAPPINATLTAGEDVQQGDIITIGADSLGYYAIDPSLPGASLRPMSSTATLLNSLQAPTTAIPGATAAQAARVGFCKLTGSNNFAIAWQNSAGLNFTIYNPLGVPQGSSVFVEAAASQLLVRMAALVGGGFALAYIASDGNPHYAVYTNAGVLVKAGTLVEAVTGNVYTLALSALNEGGFVVGWYRQVSNINQPRFAVYSAAGVLQGAITQVDTLGVNTSPGPDSMSIAAVSGGGFVIAYEFYAGTTASSKFGRYNSGGVLQGAVAAYGATVTNVEMDVFACALTDGGFVLAQYASASFIPTLTKYDATGTVVGVPFSLGTVAGAANSGVRMVAVAGGGYALLWPSAGALYFAVFNAAAVQVGSTATISTASVSVPLSLAQLSDGGFAAAISYSSSVYVFRLDPAGALLGAPCYTVVSAVATNLFVSALSQTINPNVITYVAVYGHGTSVGFSIVNSQVQKMTLAGVAIAGAAKNTALLVKISGVATLRTAFNQPYATNNQGNATPGQKMSVVGSTAVLQGVQ